MQSLASVGRPIPAAPILAAVAGGLAMLAGCSDSNGPAAVATADTGPQHPQVVLRDVLGEPLPIDSTEPYSPRTTCGRCHDVDTIAGAYHFQQGRVDALGRIDARLQRPFNSQVAVLSPGMFGKW